MSWTGKLSAKLRIGQFDEPPGSLFELKRAFGLPAWLQLVLVVLGFVATVLLTNAEYRAHGTSFGYPGPAFNAIVAPIYEELVFRGWILGRLARSCSATVAIVVSSLLFGLLHLRDIYWLDTPALLRLMAFAGLVLGPLLGYVSLRGRSVWPAVILHYLNNLLYFVRA